MKHTLLALLLLACGGGYYERSVPGRRCATLSVENENFADVRIYQEYNPLMTVVGHTTAERALCSIGLPARFRVRAIGGAFDFWLIGSQPYVEAGAFVPIYIGPTPNLSFINY